jgi:hypothetical protein
MKSHILIALTFGGLSFGAGCVFVVGAAVIPFGAEAGIPGVQEDATLSVANLNAALQAAFNVDPLLFEQFEMATTATYADLRSVMCAVVEADLMDEPRLDVNLTPTEIAPNIKSVFLRLEVVVEGGVECLKGGLRSELRVGFIPFTAEQAESLKKKLNQDLSDLADAIVQIRFLIKEVHFQRNTGSGPVVANEVLADFYIAIVEPSIPNDPATPFVDGWLEIVPFFLLNTISPTTPQRFELDPDSPVTQAIKGVLLTPPTDGSPPMVLIVEASAELLPDQLALTPVTDSGIKLDAQPEIVINGLKVVEKQL